MLARGPIFDFRVVRTQFDAYFEELAVFAYVYLICFVCFAAYLRACALLCAQMSAVVLVCLLVFPNVCLLAFVEPAFGRGVKYFYGAAGNQFPHVAE